MNRNKLAGVRVGAMGGGGGGILGGNSSGGGGLSTPKWWFKSKIRPDVQTLAARESGDSGGGELPAVQEESQATAVAEPRPALAMSPPLASSIDVPETIPTAPAPRIQPVSVSVDPDRQQISLRLSYTSALIGGFSLFIAIGIAVLIGKSLSRGPSSAIANTSTQQLRQHPPTPGVMSVPRKGEVKGANDIVEGVAPRVVSSTTPPSTGTRNPQPTFNEPKPPATFFTDDPRRQNGLNYAIIQSYPNKEAADKAAEFLTKHGVACTVEKGLPGWPLNWKDGCSVVGIRGFAKISNNPPLDAYKKSIAELGGKYSGRSKIEAFDPKMYMWKKTN
jgi:hypothetical protein